MKTAIITIAAIALQAGPGVEALHAQQPTRAEWTLPSDAAIGALVEERLSARQGTAMVVGVVDASGRRIVSRGRAGPHAADAQSTFEIGSLTKVFTATLLVDMVALGEVRLDDRVATHLGGAALPVRGRPITFVDLATHSSGLPRLPDSMPVADPRDPYADYSAKLMLAFLRQHVPTRAPGEAFEYSNLGAGLLGYLLARKAGTNYGTMLRRRITGPLGMAVTTTSGRPIAIPHDAALQPTMPWRFGPLAGAGAVRSSVADLLTFAEAHLQLRPTPLSGVAGRTRQPLGPGPNAHARMAIGWFVLDTPRGPLLYHNGMTGGSASVMLLDPVRRRGVVILGNTAAAPEPTDLALHILAGAPLPQRPVTGS